MSAAIGVAIAALSATMNAVGVNLQRLGKRRRSPLISATGVLMAAALCPIADMTSFTFAPQSLIAPVAPLCLLVNLALAPLMHGTSIHLLDVGCTVLVFSGVFVCLQSASSDAAAYSYAELTQLAAGTAFRTWAGLNLLVATGLASRVLRGGASAVAYACLSGLCGGCTMLCGKLLTLLGSLRAETGLMPLALVGACAAVFGLSQIATSAPRPTPLLRRHPHLSDCASAHVTSPRYLCLTSPRHAAPPHATPGTHHRDCRRRGDTWPQ